MNMTQRTLLMICGALFFFTCIMSMQAMAQSNQVQLLPFSTDAQSQDSASDKQPETVQARSQSRSQAQPVAPPLPATEISENPYLNTYLQLQQQIALLHRLLERERSITDMTQNYKRIGLDFNPPKPDMALCRQLPDNLACALAYPDHYADFLPPEAPLPPMTFAPVTVTDIPQSISELSADFDIDHLLWTDITCLEMQCRAVITPNISNKGARYAIKVGDRLPQGGVVESITAQGVFVSRGNKLITLSPAPASPHSVAARLQRPF